MAEAAIAIFGGTFDPIHRAHLGIIQSAFRALPIEELLLIPTYLPPHKRPLFSYEERCRMIECVLAVFEAEEKRLAPKQQLGPNRTAARQQTLQTLKIGHYERELYSAFDPEAPYFVSVARRLAKDYRHRSIYMLMGEDAFSNLSRWYAVDEILNVCTPAVFPRVGFCPKKETYAFWRAKSVPVISLPIQLEPFTSLGIRQALLTIKARPCSDEERLRADQLLRTSLLPDVYCLVHELFLDGKHPYPSRYC